MWYTCFFTKQNKLVGRLWIILIGACLLGAKAYGFDLKASELRGKNSKQPVTVLQNRFFVKTYRPEFGLLTGSFLNEAYTRTSTLGLRAGMFFNEWIGAEFQYAKTSINETDDKKALNDLQYRDLEEDKVVSPDPEINPIYSVMDVNAIIAPFYGKLNLLNRYIVYSDLYLSGGVAKVETRQGDLNALVLGLGQRFYMMESYSVRLDFRDRIYTEKRRGSSSRKNALSVDLGLSYFFL